MKRQIFLRTKQQKQQIYKKKTVIIKQHVDIRQSSLSALYFFIIQRLRSYTFHCCLLMCVAT